MAGHLDVVVGGRKGMLWFREDHVVLQVADYRSALGLLKLAMPVLDPVGKLLSFSQIGLRVAAGQRRPVELFPRPSWVVRRLVPAVRRLSAASSRRPA